MSGLFRGSQLNWAALTKEAYAIYMYIRKLTLYVTGSDITVKSDHLPLKKFLEKQTMNAKVNNWAVELEQFKIKMEWIQGAKNTLADSLSRLLEMTPEAELEKEPDGQEFGTACFEEMETVQNARGIYRECGNIISDNTSRSISGSELTIKTYTNGKVTEG